MNRYFFVFLILPSVLGLSSCKKTQFDVADLPEEPVIEVVKKRDFVSTIPAYGVYSAGLFQVNIESEDGPFVKVGQKASVQLLPGKARVPCVVSRFLRGVTAETKQGLAWLKPTESRVVGLRDGDFIFASITTEVKHDALAIPRGAVFVRDGKNWAITKSADEAGKTVFKPVEVKTGATSNDEVEITDGLNEKQSIAVSGAIGFLFPEFKAGADD